MCPTKEEYVSHLRDAGFVSVETEDLSADWREYAIRRVQNFAANRAHLTQVHGEEVHSLVV